MENPNDNFDDPFGQLVKRPRQDNDPNGDDADEEVSLQNTMMNDGGRVPSEIQKSLASLIATRIVATLVAIAYNCRNGSFVVGSLLEGFTGLFAESTADPFRSVGQVIASLLSVRKAEVKIDEVANYIKKFTADVFSYVSANNEFYVLRLVDKEVYDRLSDKNRVVKDNVYYERLESLKYLVPSSVITQLPLFYVATSDGSRSGFAKYFSFTYAVRKLVNGVYAYTGKDYDGSVGIQLVSDTTQVRKDLFAKVTVMSKISDLLILLDVVKPTAIEKLALILLFFIMNCGMTDCGGVVNTGFSSMLKNHSNWEELAESLVGLLGMDGISRMTAATALHSSVSVFVKSVLMMFDPVDYKQWVSSPIGSSNVEMALKSSVYALEPTPVTGGNNALPNLKEVEGNFTAKYTVTIKEVTKDMLKVDGDLWYVVCDVKPTHVGQIYDRLFPPVEVTAKPLNKRQNARKGGNNNSNPVNTDKVIKKASKRIYCIQVSDVLKEDKRYQLIAEKMERNQLKEVLTDVKLVKLSLVASMVARIELANKAISGGKNKFTNKDVSVTQGDLF